jgi:hypothetical protein
MCQWELMIIQCLWGIVELTAALHNTNNYKKIYIGEIGMLIGIN